MKRTIATTYDEVMNDLGYYTRRAATFITSKAMVQSLPALGFSFLGEESLLTTSLIGAGVMGVSAGLVQMDHNHRLSDTTDRYREELAKITGKAKQKIEVEDLLSVANGDARKGIPANPTLRQVVKESALQRNISVALSAVAALAAFLVVSSLSDGSVVEAFNQNHGLTHLLEHGVVGFLTYNVIKQPLHYAATKLLGLREETVDQAICAINHTRGKGKLVSQEQVLDVLMEAHPEVAESIRAQFGKAFEEMSAREKVGVLQSVPKEAFNLEKVTEDINLGHIKPEELAFMAFGQRSGVESKRKDVLPTRPPVLDSMWNFLSGLTAGFIGKAENVTPEQVRDALPPMAGTTNYRIDTPDENTASFSVHNEQDTEKGKKSFAAMVGRKHSPEGVSHVERYEQRLQERDMQATPAIS